MPNPCTDLQFTEAVQKSVSISDVLRRLLRAPGRVNYTWVKHNIQRLNLDVSHWPKKLNRSVQKRSLNELLVANSPYPKSGRLKERMIREGLLKRECAVCALTRWRDKPLTLILDHINGDRYDCRRENLRLLCPNCNSQTLTYCGRNKRSGTFVAYLCADCGKPCTKGSFRCRACFLRQLNQQPRKTKIKWPAVSIVETMLKDCHGNFCAVARELGVTDNAVRKYLRRCELASSFKGRTGDC